MIDLTFAKKIGAERFNKRNKVFYRLNDGAVQYYHSIWKKWIESSFGMSDFNEFERINFDAQPQIKVEYVKVTDSIFDLRDEFENGELYKNNSSHTYDKITTAGCLCDLWNDGGIYRCIETPVTWRDRSSDYLSKCKHLTASCDLSLCITEPKSDDTDDLQEWIELQEEFKGLCAIMNEENK